MTALVYDLLFAAILQGICWHHCSSGQARPQLRKQLRVRRDRLPAKPAAGAAEAPGHPAAAAGGCP